MFGRTLKKLFTFSAITFYKSTVPDHPPPPLSPPQSWQSWQRVSNPPILWRLCDLMCYFNFMTLWIYTCRAYLSTTRTLWCVLCSPIICTQQQCVLRSIICRYQRFTLQCSKMSLLFKNYWLVEVAYLLIRFNETKFFPWNTKNSERYGVNKQNTHHHSLRERQY